MVRMDDINSRFGDMTMKIDDTTRDLPHQLERLTRVEEQVQNSNATVDVDRMKNDLDVLKERIVHLESQLQNAQNAQDTLRFLDERVDALDDFVVRWEEQSSMIMVEHEQFGDIVRDIWEAIDALSGDRTRVQLPAGSQRGYGYD